MRIAGKTELQERLAAEYALGTLRGQARVRFQRWLRSDATLRRALDEWQARLAPIAVAVPQVRPPARVWEGVLARLGPVGPPGASGRGASFWRAISFITSGMAAALLIAVVTTSPRKPSPAPAPAIVRLPSNEMGQSYLAVLSDPKTQKPMLVVSAGRDSSELWVKGLDPTINVPDKSLELWALPAGQAPRSLGVVVPGDKPTSYKLAAPAEQSLGDIPALAVSLEPRGGSTTGAPTGPVLYTGACLKYW